MTIKNENIIDIIIEKISCGYEDYEIEKFLERQKIDSSEFEYLIDAAKSKILDYKLKVYPKQNKQTFILCLSLFIISFIFFLFILPSFLRANTANLFSILGAICITLSGFYSLMYYKSWEQDFIKQVGKPKLNLEFSFVLCIFPAILFYCIISWSFDNGDSYNLYKLSLINKLIKLFKK